MCQVLAIVVVLVAGLSATSDATLASIQVPQTPPTAQPPNQPTTIAGKWTVTGDNGPYPAVLDIKLDGKKVSGTLTGDAGAMTVDGEFADSKLTFSITSPDGAAVVTFTLTLKDDVFTGVADNGQGGQFAVRAERAKGK